MVIIARVTPKSKEPWSRYKKERQCIRAVKFFDCHLSVCLKGPRRISLTLLRIFHYMAHKSESGLGKVLRKMVKNYLCFLYLSGKLGMSLQPRRGNEMK